MKCNKCKHATSKVLWTNQNSLNECPWIEKHLKDEFYPLWFCTKWSESTECKVHSWNKDQLEDMQWMLSLYDYV